MKYAFRVSFVGGEPLAHPDIFKFFDICRKAKKLVMFPSNGLLISKRIKEFKSNGPHSLQGSTIVPSDDKFGNVWQDDFWNSKYLVAHRKNYNKNFPFHPACEFCYEGAKHARYFI